MSTNTGSTPSDIIAAKLPENGENSSLNSPEPTTKKGYDRDRREWFRLVRADSLKWLGAQRDHSIRNIVTGFPDFNEVRDVMDWKSYIKWVPQIATLCFQKVHKNGYCIFIQTDRKLGKSSNPKGVYELYSKSATLIEAANLSKSGVRLLWHKIAAFQKPGEVSIRPGYSHILCFSVHGQHDLQNQFTDIIRSPTKIYENATPLEAVEMVINYIGRYYRPTDRAFTGTLPFDVIDPFIGQGSVGLVAMDKDLTVLGLDIDQNQIESAYQNLSKKLENLDLRGGPNIKVVHDDVFDEKRRILHVDSRQLDYLRRGRQGPQLAKFLSQLVIREGLEFPYKRYHHTERSVLRSFRALQNLDFTKRLKILPYTPENVRAMACVNQLRDHVRLPIKYCDFGSNMGCYRVDPILGQKELTVYLQTSRDYEEFDWLSDYWTEDLRMGCQTDNNASPLEKWSNPNDLSGLVNFILSPNRDDGRKGGLGLDTLTNVELREGIFQDRYWRECTQFKPSLFYCLIKLLDAKTVLDTSAGWGDRLIGAMAANVTTYTGIDPEMALQKRYEMIYQTFQDFVAPSHSYFVFPLRSEDPKIVQEIGKTVPNPEYDMIFSSPPFFKYESYSSQFADSYGDLDEQTWLDQFMYPTLKNTWRFLKPGGYYVLYLCDTSGRNRNVAFTSTENINLWIGGNLEGAQLVGTLGTGRVGGKKFLTCWIWTKSVDLT